MPTPRRLAPAALGRRRLQAHGNAVLQHADPRLIAAFAAHHKLRAQRSGAPARTLHHKGPGFSLAHRRDIKYRRACQQPDATLSAVVVDAYCTGCIQLHRAAIDELDGTDFSCTSPVIGFDL